MSRVVAYRSEMTPFGEILPHTGDGRGTAVLETVLQVCKRGSVCIEIDSPTKFASCFAQCHFRTRGCESIGSNSAALAASHHTHVIDFFHRSVTDCSGLSTYLEFIRAAQANLTAAKHIPARCTTF